MAIYIYSKSTENPSTFDPVIEKIRGDETEIYASVEHRRNFRELQKIKDAMSTKDILVIGSLFSLGINESDIVNELEHFVRVRRILVVCSIPSTYEYGVAQPMNQAIISTVLSLILSANAKVIPFRKSKRSNAGRAKIEFPDNWDELYERWEQEKISSKEFLAKSGLKRATFYNMMTEYREIQKMNHHFIQRYKQVSE